MPGDVGGDLGLDDPRRQRFRLCLGLRLRLVRSLFLEVAHEYDETVAAIKVLEQKKDDIVNRVCEAIGEAERGVLPDGSGWSWKKQSKPKMVADPTQPRHEFRVVRRFGASKED